ncbi:MAG: transcription termination/antitermination NusG family protein [Ginsengibacter sp.]
MKAKWYGIYTKQNCEKKVVECLNRRQIENFYPTRIVKSRSALLRRPFEEALFPSHVFVKIEEHRLKTLKALPGVINYLFWLDSPIVINDSEIELMKVILAENRDIRIQKTKINFNKINDGPKISSLELDGIKSFKITLRSLGYHMITQMELPKLTIIPAIQNTHKTSAELELLN